MTLHHMPLIRRGLMTQSQIPTAAPKPVPGPDGLYDRQSEVEVELIIYNHDRDKGKVKLSYQEVIARARKHQLQVEMKDDTGSRMVGVTIPGTARVDGPLLYVVGKFKLHHSHKVEKTLGIRDFSQEEQDRIEQHRREIDAVKADVVMAVLDAKKSGATDAEAIEVAKKAGVGAVPAGLLVQAIHVLIAQIEEAKKKAGAGNEFPVEEAAPAIADAIRMIAEQPEAEKFLEEAKASVQEMETATTTTTSNDPRSAGGSGEVSGTPGVQAKISGEVAAKLSPDGSVG